MNLRLVYESVQTKTWLTLGLTWFWSKSDGLIGEFSIESVV